MIPISHRFFYIYLPITACYSLTLQTQTLTRPADLTFVLLLSPDLIPFLFLVHLVAHVIIQLRNVSKLSASI